MNSNIIIEDINKQQCDNIGYERYSNVIKKGTRIQQCYNIGYK